MRFTRPVSNRVLPGGAVVLSGILSFAAMNCTNDEQSSSDGFDASSDAAQEAAVAPSFDASAEDVATFDAAPFDASAPPVSCMSERCAVSLTSVTTDNDTQTFCALLHDGTVTCWGANDGGQLGRGDDAGSIDSAIPERIVGLPKVAILQRSCAITEDGALYCWGSGRHPPQADVRTTQRSPVKLPLEHVSAVSVTSDVGCAVSEGAVFCWGKNDDRQVSPSDSPVLEANVVAVPIPSGSKARDISVGKATIVLLEDGSMLSWGANPPLGRVSSIVPDPFPQPIDLGNTVFVDIQRDNACAIVMGTGYCWGAAPPSPRQLDLSRALPTPVVTPEPLRQMSTVPQKRVQDLMGMSSLPDRWCGVGISGAVYCWGYNASGQVGDGTRDFAYDPVKVQGLPAPAIEVELTFDSTCALLTNGAVHCWGSNYHGQLGTGQMRVSSLVPQEVRLP